MKSLLALMSLVMFAFLTSPSAEATRARIDTFNVGVEAPWEVIGNERDVRANEKAGTVSVSVDLDSSASSEISVDVATEGGTATPGADYQSISERIVFAAGITTQSITVPIQNDSDEEADEIFNVTLSNASGAEFSDRTSVVTIVDDDNGLEPVLPVISLAPVFVTEDAGSATLEVRLDQASSTTVSVSLATRADSAIPAQDYYGVYQQLEFLPGETVVRVQVSILDDSAD